MHGTALRFLVVVAVAGWFAANGCRHCDRCPPRFNNTYVVPAAPAATYDRYQGAPAEPAYDDQPYAQPQAPAAAPSYQEQFAPAPATSNWRPTPNQRRPHVVEQRPFETPRVEESRARLLPPESIDSNPRARKPSVTEQSGTDTQGADATRSGEEDPTDPKPPVRVELDKIATEDSAEFPVDIPQFNPVEDKIAAGLEPLPDGYDWLADNGYRTVIHLRGEGEADSALRSEIEGRAMRYVALDISPDTINRSLVDEFSRVIHDEQNQPVFVFDCNGMLTGSMWYLHFRLIDNLTDSEARTKAARLGLKEESSGDYTDLWLAINQTLRTQ